MTPKLFIDTTDDEDFIEGSAREIYEDLKEEIDIENEMLPEHETGEAEEHHKEDLSEEETLRRSEFFELHGLDLLSLDMSCMQNFVSGITPFLSCV